VSVFKFSLAVGVISFSPLSVTDVDDLTDDSPTCCTLTPVVSYVVTYDVDVYVYVSFTYLLFA